MGYERRLITQAYLLVKAVARYFTLVSYGSDAHINARWLFSRSQKWGIRFCENLRNRLPIPQLWKYIGSSRIWRKLSWMRRVRA